MSIVFIYPIHIHIDCNLQDLRLVADGAAANPFIQVGALLSIELITSADMAGLERPPVSLTLLLLVTLADVARLERPPVGLALLKVDLLALDILVEVVMGLAGELAVGDHVDIVLESGGLVALADVAGLEGESVGLALLYGSINLGAGLDGEDIVAGEAVVGVDGVELTRGAVFAGPGCDEVGVFGLSSIVSHSVYTFYPNGLLKDNLQKGEQKIQQSDPRGRQEW